jgi:hypothetical protein
MNLQEYMDHCEGRDEPTFWELVMGTAIMYFGAQIIGSILCAASSELPYWFGI